MSPQETVKISYEDKEGTKYSEVHGDPEKTLEVKSVAEQKGEEQPNVDGTTPDPHDPELTAWEKERRGEVEKATKPESEKDKDSDKEKSHAPAHNKQADKPADK
jgi:hypothetical protein